MVSKSIKDGFILVAIIPCSLLLSVVVVYIDELYLKLIRIINAFFGVPENILSLNILKKENCAATLFSPSAINPSLLFLIER